MMHPLHGQCSIGQKATPLLIKWLSWTGESAMFVGRVRSTAVRLTLTLTILMPVGFGVNW
jgi:hypothetical protein